MLSKVERVLEACYSIKWGLLRNLEHRITPGTNMKVGRILLEHTSYFFGLPFGMRRHFFPKSNVKRE